MLIHRQIPHQTYLWIKTFWFRNTHDDVIKWKPFPHYWPFMLLAHREIPAQRPVTRIFKFSLICPWTNGWVNNRNTGDLRHHYANTVILLWVLHVSIYLLWWRHHSHVLDIGVCFSHQRYGSHKHHDKRQGYGLNSHLPFLYWIGSHWWASARKKATSACQQWVYSPPHPPTHPPRTST